MHVHKVPLHARRAGAGAWSPGSRELCADAGLAPGDVTGVFHGTTIATNAALQYRGATAGMITTRGFRDIVHIGRHQRPQHYSLMQDIPWQSHPLVQRRHRKVVTERLIPPRGEIEEPLDEQQVARRRSSSRPPASSRLPSVPVLLPQPRHEGRARRSFSRSARTSS